MNRLPLLLLLWLSAPFCLAQIPPDYYTSAAGKTGTDLQKALHDIIDNHTNVSYATLWTSFQSTDKKANGKVWDMYSDIPGGTPPYEFTFVTDQCGNYGGEGDCYNREHSWPKSWFGGEVAPMYTDLFHLCPTDGYVNNMRSNYPFGDVGTASWTSQNGSRLGASVTPGYSGIVFEPRDDYKGDFARNYFYMATRYYQEDSSWPGSDMVTGSQFKPWARAMLLIWAQQDPVSQKETERNNAVYLIQHNRNPFIDHPEYANGIWGTNTGLADGREAVGLQVYPNPVLTTCTLILPPEYQQQNACFSVYSESGMPVHRSLSVQGETASLAMDDLAPGLYLIRLELPEQGTVYQARIIKR
jgi:endonuclease I